MPDDLVRPDVTQVVRILEAVWRAESPPKRTQLQRARGMNYTLFARYLDFLVARGLLELRESGDGFPTVWLTRRGWEAHRMLAAGIREMYGEFTRP